MQLKIFELRDRATFIPIMAVSIDGNDDSPAVRYLLGSAGYKKIGGHPDRWVILSNLTYPDKSNVDPYCWNSRTYQAAHLHILEHFDELENGAVVDVEFILGEVAQSKKSQRFTSIPWGDDW